MSIKISCVVDWRRCDDDHPDAPGDYLVLIETDDGESIHTLTFNDKQQWIHEGEPTYCQPCLFHPVLWADPKDLKPELLKPFTSLEN